MATCASTCEEEHVCTCAGWRAAGADAHARMHLLTHAPLDKQPPTRIGPPVSHPRWPHEDTPRRSVALRTHLAPYPPRCISISANGAVGGSARGRLFLLWARP